MSVQPHFMTVVITKSHVHIDVSLALYHQVLPNPLIHASHLQISVHQLNYFSIISNESENRRNLEPPHSGHTLPCQCAAKCLQDSLAHLPRELQQNPVHVYSEMT